MIMNDNDISLAELKDTLDRKFNEYMHWGVPIKLHPEDCDQLIRLIIKLLEGKNEA